MLSSILFLLFFCLFFLVGYFSFFYLVVFIFIFLFLGMSSLFEEEAMRFTYDDRRTLDRERFGLKLFPFI
ncbi:uncharacterized protein FTOL_01580 [Fusarium torulosum]|uniref:Uncharacterized protein n=1 Tax=Fusarium torulosum TaxID=33205 RepID=A0AAE8SDS3_9HYPO|nr:uncharacterized protein FTOL_01580 [Fusarium torulosum]